MADTYAAMLRSAEDGAFMDAAGDELTHAIMVLRQQAETNNRRMKGKIVVTFDLEVDQKGFLETEGKIDVKLPKVKRQRSMHWTDEDGEILNRKPEKQLELTGLTGGAAQTNGASVPKQTVKAV